MNIFILVAIALAALKLWKKIPISWTIIAIIGAAGILIPLFSNATTGLGGLFQTTPPGPKDACGCAPGQKVSVAKKGLFGYKNKQVVPCNEALILLTKRKYSSFGCMNT
jgi:hypothetical protein